MPYLVTVKITRVKPGRYPAGVTYMEITSEVDAVSWGEAVSKATENILDNLSALTGGPIGCTITDVEAKSEVIGRG